MRGALFCFRQAFQRLCCGFVVALQWLCSANALTLGEISKNCGTNHIKASGIGFYPHSFYISPTVYLLSFYFSPTVLLLCFYLAPTFLLLFTYFAPTFYLHGLSTGFILTLYRHYTDLTLHLFGYYSAPTTLLLFGVHGT